MRIFTFLLVLLILGFSCSKVDNEKPNIIFIYVDDLGYSDLGYTGSDYYETPTIDSLSQKGMIFSRAYTNPTCAPSRASLMTGKYSPRHNIYTVDAFAHTPDSMRSLKTLDSKRVLDLDHLTWPEILKQNNYQLAHFGKWHLGNHLNSSPTDQGFHINIGGGMNGDPGRTGYFSPYKIPAIENGPEGEYLTDRLTTEALNFMENNKEKPFCIYLAHYTVHVPLEAPAYLVEYFKNKSLGERYYNAIYAAMIKSLDLNVARIINKLKALNLTEKTIIIFTSDNGGQSMVTSNYPLKGQKGEIYEGGIRVPMFVVWPGTIAEGTRNDQPISVVDFFPTFLDITQSNADSVKVDGISFYHQLFNQDENINRGPIFYHLPCYNGDGIHNANIWQPPASAIIDGDWKLIEFYEDDHIELYNLQEDVGESINLVNQNPSKKDELYQKLQNWKKEVKAFIPYN